MRTALRYPLAGDAEDRYLVAWILHLLHALVVPFVPLAGLLGMLGGVTRAAATGESADGDSSGDAAVAPPSFRAPRRLLADTGRVVGVTAAYALPVAAVLGVGAVLLPTGLPSDAPATPIALLAAGLLGLLLPLAYAAPASLAHALAGDSLRAGFDREAVGRTLGHAQYFTQWAAGLGALAVAIASAAALGDVLVGYLLSAYFEVLAFACFGWGAAPTLRT
jgi:hypothetical protein